jgi:hypothetical protein
MLAMAQIAKHPDVEDWEGEYYQAKLDDEAASYEVRGIPDTPIDIHVQADNGSITSAIVGDLE